MPELDKLCTLDDSSDLGPALASHSGRLFIAWRGAGNPQINIGVFNGDLRGLAGRETTPESSSHAPALVSTTYGLFAAWKGDGNEQLNTARVEWYGNTAGGAGVSGLTEKAVLNHTSEAGPALAAENAYTMLLGWRGAGNDHLNVGSGGGEDFEATTIDDSSDIAPALAWNDGGIYLAWKGAGNPQLNARAQKGGAKAMSQAHTQIFDESSSHAPALAAHNGRVYMAWKGDGNEHINLGVLDVEDANDWSINVYGVSGKQTFGDTTEQSPALVSHDGSLLIAWRGAGNDHLNLARAPV